MANRFLSNIKINDAYTFPASDGTSGQVITTDGAGNLSFQSAGEAGATVIYKDLFTGNASTVVFTLANSVDNEVKTQVYFDGVYQSKENYIVSGNEITFSTAPPSGTAIEVITFATVAAADYNQKLNFYGKAVGAITKGDAVMFAGAQGDHFLITKATQAGLDANHEYFLGLAAHDFANNQYGYVTQFGRLEAMDTSDYIAGDILWFDSEGTVAGALTTTVPSAPNTKIQIAAVVRVHQNEGVIFVRPTVYHEISELHDVSITSAADKDLLSWNATSGVWENTKTLGDITTGNITTSGTVDGVDVSLFKSDYDVHNHDSRYYTETEIDTLLTNKSNWDTAYSWGDHSLVGYLTSFTETDPVFSASPSAGITSTQITNWNTAYGWGDHSTQSYATQTYVGNAISALVDSAPATLDTLNELAAALGDDPNFATTVSNSIGLKWTQDNVKISNWDTAYSWGNHASAGYLTSFTETDPTVPSHVKSITTTNISNWNTAYGWGNHATAGYLTSLPVHTHDYLYSAPTQLASTNLNDMTTSGVYFSNTSYSTNTNIPHANYFTMLNIMNGDRQAQLWFGDTPGAIYWRPKQGATGWHGWENVITSNNIGSQSVSYANNAGTLDSIDSTQFLRSDVNDNLFSGQATLAFENQTSFARMAFYNLDFWDWDYGSTMTINGGYVYSQGSFRAPIFYDSNDTNYYVDPNSSGLSAKFNGNLEIYARSAAWAEGLRVRVPTTNTWGGIRWTRDRANYDGNWALGFKGSGDTSDDLVFWANNGGAEADKARLDKAGNLTVTSGVYAPIFYDSNNTAYYVDPAQTSNFNEAIFGAGTGYSDQGIRISYGNYYSGYGRIRFYQDGTNHSTIHSFSSSWQSGTLQGHSTGAINFDATNGVTFGAWNDVSMWVDNVGNSQSKSSSRAPIFYDSNNTGYFLNPDTTGVSLKIKGGIVTDAPSGSVLLEHQVAEANAWIFKENAANWGLYWFNAGSNSGQGIGSYTTVGAELFGMNNAVTGFNPPETWAGINTDARAAWMLSNYSGYFWSQGTQYSETDMRAPIFYDSNNTGYYTDPASTSRMSRIDFNNLYYASDTNYGFLNSNAYVDTLNSGYDSDPLELVYYRGSEVRIGDGGGNKPIKAGIYYDGVNTGYYVDPASSSSLFYVSDYLSNPYITKRHSGSDFPNGTLVETDIPASSTNGNSFVLEATGKSYSTAPPFSFMAQGYLYNNTIINYSGIHFSLPAFSQMKIFELNGYLHFWWPRWGYWNSFQVSVRNADGNSVNRVKSITDSAEPTGSKKVTVNMAQVAVYDNDWSAGRSLYAATYYDTNNTGYYVDPASTSNLNAISVNGYADFQGDAAIGGGSGYGYIKGYSPNWNHMAVFRGSVSGSTSSPSISGAHNTTFVEYAEANSTTGWFFKSSSTGTYEEIAKVTRDHSYFTGSARAPIFYDSNDTGYYVDPAGQTNLGGNNDFPLRVSKTSGVNSGCVFFQNISGDNSWGIVGEFRVGGGPGSDRPSILFSHGFNTNTWSVGFGYNDDNFRINIDHGHRNGGWGTTRMLMDRSGNVTFSGDVTAYSDISVKENIRLIQSPLDKVKLLNGVTYNRTDLEDKSDKIGFIAQDVLNILPEVVKETEDGKLSVAYGNITAVLVEAIKELSKKVEELENKLNGNN